MRKLIIAILCLGMLAWSLTAFAQEPTMNETINFINKKLKSFAYGDPYNRHPTIAHISIQGNDITKFLNPKRPAYYPGDVVIEIHWGDFYEEIIVIKDFGNMEIDTFGVKTITIKDPEHEETMIIYYHKHKREYKMKTSSVHIELDNKDIPPRMYKALRHMQKLYKEKYPHERKEPF